MVPNGQFHTLLVCPTCKGFNYLTAYVMKTYISENMFTYCSHCDTTVRITPELKQIAREIRA